MATVIFLAALLAVGACQDGPGARIVGGVNAAQHAWPWQVSLRVLSSGTFRHTCGGSILDNRHVITAAHCVNPSSPGNYRVHVGAHTLSGTTANEQSIAVTRIVNHPQYNANGNGFPNDISVLTLASDIVFNSGVQPVQLPVDDVDDFSGKTCFITGWGRTTGGATTLPNTLQEVRTDVVTNTNCRNLMPTNLRGYVLDTHVCVYDSFTSGRTGACNGDSGGPVSCLDNNGEWTLVGLASWVISGCVTTYPSVYVRTSKFLSWIAGETYV